MMSIFFFIQAEDGIRDTSVTGVQTCALPIFAVRVIDDFIVNANRTVNLGLSNPQPPGGPAIGNQAAAQLTKIGRATCRERVKIAALSVILLLKIKILISISAST